MIDLLTNPTRTLEVRHTYRTAREKVFAAWTRAEALQNWWGVAEGYTVPIAEVDLRVGGRYRLGMKPPNSEELVILVGEYQVIQPPEKLVFTWGFEGGPASAQSLITLLFVAHGAMTELVLTHQYPGPEAQAENFRQGWLGMFERLQKVLAQL